MNKIQERIEELEKEGKKYGLSSFQLTELSALKFAQKEFIDMIDKHMEECKDKKGNLNGESQILIYATLDTIKDELKQSLEESK